MLLLHLWRIEGETPLSGGLEADFDFQNWRLATHLVNNACQRRSQSHGVLLLHSFKICCDQF